MSTIQRQPPKPNAPNPHKRKAPTAAIQTERRTRTNGVKRRKYLRGGDDAGKVPQGGLEAFYDIRTAARPRGGRRRAAIELSSVVYAAPAEGKGYGLFTKISGVQAGEILMSEKAILDLKTFTPKATVSAVQKLVRENKHAELQKIMSLSAAAGKPDTEYERIRNNVWGIENKKTTGRHVLWYGIAHANHSCRPNAWVDYEEDGSAHLRALENIDRNGTEITVDYIDLDNWGWTPNDIPLAAECQAETQNGWGFACNCEACSDPNTDIIRMRVQTAEQAMGITKSKWSSTRGQIQEMQTRLELYTDDLASQKWWHKLRDFCGYTIIEYENLEAEQPNGQLIAHNQRRLDHLRAHMSRAMLHLEGKKGELNQRA
ncbi:hypothetical protein F5Y15DRAFT_425382 [Xylariaceae sp. FL0016]|nr:hypothetical protein F5Y15DRAFT_425382 [Xylariaceae sp. FL0016]